MVLVGLHVSGRFHPALLVAVATFGNVLGACINWLLGRYLLHFQDRRWFPVKQQALERATRHYNRYGLWSLMLAWAPIIGDPLTVVAGFLRTPFWLFTLLVLIGKGGRYALLVGLF
ncbi:DedA family protein [Acanthopleuribacter pedis]|uniref:DedA family protein n=2 Tax=Acanthopleuribacter pedis TaxID=442870 RepID=A0A8J7Q8C5_9BACT|nr:DedA family protein [Acanthopleuribacter pedis]